ncbi:MAG: OsmC family protein [Gammaproteobacteria bacterium]|nr:OsmC family protein [Gammaproteobacteria bacterium]
MASQRLEFEGHDGSLLAARMDWPAAAPRACALFAHCFTCGKDIFAASRISAGLAALGIAVLRFDFTGLGMSQGEFANTNFSSNVADLIRAADFLRGKFQAPALLVGHSLGGAAVLAAAGEIPEVRAVATIGAPSEPAHITGAFGDQVDEIRARGELKVQLAGRPFRIQRQFLEDIERTRLRGRVERLGRALLVMHSPRDETVGIDHARRLFEAAKHPKSFVSLDDADHLLRRREDAEYAAQVLAAWASRYLPRDAAEAPASGSVEVTETRIGQYTQTVRVGRHALTADEPRSAGGDDAGPSPYDFLLAGLGACTSMTLRMYAQRKQLPLQRVSVRLRHARVHAADCEDCEHSQGQITEITREVVIEGALDDAQRARLLEIADKCPVHRTLTGEIKIRTRLADQAPTETPAT